MNASQLLIVRRRHAGNFTQIPNSLIRNEHLSLKALGVIVHLLSLPPGCRISLEGLCAARKEGETAMRTAIKQLESLNYMRIVRDRSASGRFIQSRWIVSDEPIVDWAPYLENPLVERPVMDRPVLGDHLGVNRALQNHGFSEKRQALFEHSNLQLNRALMHCESWDEGAIAARGNALFEFAVKLWPGPETS